MVLAPSIIRALTLKGIEILSILDIGDGELVDYNVKQCINNLKHYYFFFFFA